jgi:hypothetical protein
MVSCQNLPFLLFAGVAKAWSSTNFLPDKATSQYKLLGGVAKFTLMKSSRRFATLTVSTKGVTTTHCREATSRSTKRRKGGTTKIAREDQD